MSGLKNNTLVELVVSNCTLGVEGGSILSDLLQSNKSLTLIDVSNSFMGEKSGFALAFACRVHPKLATIRAYGNSWSASVGKHFVPVVARESFISFDGVPVKALKENSITELDVSGDVDHTFGRCAGVILSHLLNSNTSLTILDHSSCSGSSCFTIYLLFSLYRLVKLLFLQVTLWPTLDVRFIL